MVMDLRSFQGLFGNKPMAPVSTKTPPDLSASLPVASKPNELQPLIGTVRFYYNHSLIYPEKVVCSYCQERHDDYAYWEALADEYDDDADEQAEGDLGKRHQANCSCYTPPKKNWELCTEFVTSIDESKRRLVHAANERECDVSYHTISDETRNIRVSLNEDVGDFDFNEMLLSPSFLNWEAVGFPKMSVLTAFPATRFKGKSQGDVTGNRVIIDIMMTMLPSINAFFKG